MRKNIFIILILGVLILTFLPNFSDAMETKQLPVNTKVVLNPQNNHSYSLINESMTWSKAKNYCESLGGHLAVISSQADTDFIKNLMKNGNKNYYWLGGRKTNNKWKWITGEAFSYTNWASGEPNNEAGIEESLMAYRDTGKWNDNRDAANGPYNITRFGFICEWPEQQNLYSETIKVTIDGKLQTYPQPPVMINSRVMVPLRGIFESLGAKVTWKNETQTITATKGDTTIILKIGDKNASINGVSVLLDQPALLINGSTMVPVRFVSEALGCKVDWDSASQTVIISTVNNLPAPTKLAFPLKDGNWSCITYNDLNGGFGHVGLDYRAFDIAYPNLIDNKEPVNPVAKGKVYLIKEDEGIVIIKHETPLVLKDGKHIYRTWYSKYAHMKSIPKASLNADPNVDVNTFIGNVSNVNALNMDMNPHLHFGIYMQEAGAYDYWNPENNGYTILPSWILGLDKATYKGLDSETEKRIAVDVSDAPDSN